MKFKRMLIGTLVPTVLAISACNEGNQDSGGGSGNSCCSNVTSSTLGNEFSGIVKNTMATATITVTNQGSGTATGFGASTGYSASAFFDYAGGAYPGTGGTCSTSLAASASCTIVVAYTPVTSGQQSLDFDLQYYSGTSLQTYTIAVSGTAVEATPTVTNINPGTGGFSGGYTVTLTGTNFASSVTKVTFGGRECTNYLVTSSTELSCTAPVGNSAGTVDVVVTNTSGGGLGVSDPSVTLINAFTFSESAYGNGALGDVTITSNTYAQLSSAQVTNIDTSGTTLTVSGYVSSYAAGDELVWHVRAATSDTTCGGGFARGNWGFVRVVSANDTNSQVVIDRDFTGGSGASVNNVALAQTDTVYSSTPFCTLILQEVPNYHDLTLDGNFGGFSLEPASFATGGSGILALKVSGTFTIGNGIAISASASGFVGGNGTDSQFTLASSGDGTSGKGSASSSPSGTGGGGAGVNNNLVGAGGGGNAAAGGNSGGGISGGAANVCANSGILGEDCLFQGGGGGGGATYNSINAAKGGTGGGIVIIFANATSGDALISAVGAGPTTIVGGNDGHFGGGAGGSIYFAVNDIGSSNITLNVTGGDGHGYGLSTGINNGGGGGSAGVVGGGYCATTGGSVTVVADGGTGGPAQPTSGANGTAGNTSVLTTADSTRAWCI